jgi:hypothetical protein
MLLSCLETKDDDPISDKKDYLILFLTIKTLKKEINYDKINKNYFKMEHEHG